MSVDARNLAAGIGSRIMESIAGEMGEIGHNTGRIRIDEISTEKIKQGGSVNEAGKSVASTVGPAVAAKVRAEIRKDIK
jgi:hypothetical protein